MTKMTIKTNKTEKIRGQIQPANVFKMENKCDKKSMIEIQKDIQTSQTEPSYCCTAILLMVKV